LDIPPCISTKLRHLRICSELTIKKQSLIYVCTKNPNEASNNSRIVTKKCGTRVITNITYSSRLCFVKIESIPSNLATIQVYMPTTKTDDEEVEEVYAGIDEVLMRY